MKVVIFKHCYNLHFGSQKETGVILYEIDNPIKELISKGYDVTVCTIKRYHKYAFPGVSCITWEELENIYNSFDIAIIFNGPFNCYGGKISDPAIYSYRFLNQFEGPILFCVTDTAIPIGDAAGWIEGKNKKGEYLDINPVDLDFDPKKIHCLTQTHNIEKFKDHWKGDQNRFNQYELFNFHFYAMKKDNLQLTVSNEITRDLIYYGNQRSGKRNEKFIKYFCGHSDDLKVDIYGKWKEKDFDKIPENNPNFLGPIDTRDLNVEINKSLATVYISDKFNEDCIFTTRLYEAVFNRTILFVDVDNDPQKKIFPNFFYVSSRRELYDKIKLLKENPDIREKLLKKQLECLYNDFKIMQDFPNRWDRIIKERLK
jgi:hypothetical protein